MARIRRTMLWLVLACLVSTSSPLAKATRREFTEAGTLHKSWQLSVSEYWESPLTRSLRCRGPVERDSCRNHMVSDNPHVITSHHG